MGLRSWLRGEHRHDWEIGAEVWIGPTLVARRLDCPVCGHSEANLTGAGWQQVGWWVSRGLDHQTAVAVVWAGDDALGRWPGQVNEHGLER